MLLQITASYSHTFWPPTHTRALPTHAQAGGGYRCCQTRLFRHGLPTDHSCSGSDCVQNPQPASSQQDRQTTGATGLPVVHRCCHKLKPFPADAGCDTSCVSTGCSRDRRCQSLLLLLLLPTTATPGLLSTFQCRGNTTKQPLLQAGFPCLSPNNCCCCCCCQQQPPTAPHHGQPCTCKTTQNMYHFYDNNRQGHVV